MVEQKTNSQRRRRTIDRRVREARLLLRGAVSTDHPIMAHIIPIRRCNLSCAYCNEYDNFSKPVSLSTMLHRIELLGNLKTGVITLSGGEPLLHPELDEIISGIRRHATLAGLITNGYLLTAERVNRLNDAGLDYLQISIDNVLPDEVSKKSLKVLDRKLEWLAEYAEFDITINSVLGSEVKQADDAYQIAKRSRELGFESTVGILHDGNGQLKPLSSEQMGVYERIFGLRSGLFSFTHHDRFQQNIVRAVPNTWHCPAGGRFLYICEDGLVHYCSQQRGFPAIPLEKYTREDLIREGMKPKGCAPFCTISCVHQTAMLESFRTQPKETLAGIINRRKERDPSWNVPASIRTLEWMFLRDSKTRNLFGALAMKAFGIKRSSANMQRSE